MEHRYKIIMFACLKWGYGAADLAGVSRLKYTPSVKIVKVRCTGRIDVKLILFAIKSGADGVMVVGWKPNECQFKTGNFTAQKHVDFANHILEKRGFGNQRVNMYWCSSAEGEKLVKSVEDAYEKVQRIGPNPINLVKGNNEVISAPIEWIL
jgi:coenzyme F420-reducing hydrogenase delta subunit